MIPVTKPFLPPRHEYDELLDGIYERCWLTNNGPLVHELEGALGTRLDVPAPLFVANGTVALQLAIGALGIGGEVITTPFSYVATTSALVWEGCTPVFADIEPTTFTIDAAAVEAAITPRTSAIVATHVFGTPCDLDALATVADRHGLALVYDGAHSFATRYGGRSVFSFGDVTTCSFHATKLFHTVEGGGLFTGDPELRAALARMRNFGHVDYTTFDGVGINAKGSELHAAMGLCNLRHVDTVLARRRAIHDHYAPRWRRWSGTVGSCCRTSAVAPRSTTPTWPCCSRTPNGVSRSTTRSSPTTSTPGGTSRPDSTSSTTSSRWCSRWPTTWPPGSCASRRSTR